MSGQSRAARFPQRRPLMKTLALALTAGAVATLAFASLPAASVQAAGKSPFCFAGSPTPKYVCDAIKANTKPKPAAKVRHETVKAAVSNAR